LSRAAPPLFLVPELGAGAPTAALADALGAELAVHALPPVAADGDAPRTVEGLAAHFVRIIRDVQPAGPYRLAGWSFGGVVAYEVATQLLGRDEAVEFLALFDAFHPALLRRVAPYGSIGGSHDATDELARFYVRLAANAGALNAYAIQPAPLAVHLFTADDRSGVAPALDESAASLGWTPTIAARDVHVVPLRGTHESIVTRDAGALAAAVARSVRDAEGRAPRAGGAAFEPQVTIQTGKRRDRDRAAIVCVPGAGDHVVQFVDFVTEIGDAWPVHGLQYRGMDDELVPHTSVEAAAAVYLKAIDDVQPDGRVHLIGHSFGGWIAFELALRMTARDRPPRSLTLIDSDPPNGRAAGRDITAAGVFAEFIHALELAAERPLGIEDAVLEQLDQGARLRLVHERMVAVGLMPRRSHPDMLAGSIRAFGVALRTGYAPRTTYRGALSLALASDPRLGAGENVRLQADVFAGWQRWAPAATRWNAPGNHLTMLKPPHVRLLSEWWSRAAMQEAGPDFVRS
jgi:thioesterase domain-containing protein